MMPWVRAALTPWAAPGSAGDARSSRPAGPVITCTFMPCFLCFPEQRGRSAATRSIGSSVPSRSTMPWWRRSSPLRQGLARGPPGPRRPRRCTGRPWWCPPRNRRRAGRRYGRTAGGPRPSTPAVRRAVGASGFLVRAGVRPAPGEESQGRSGRIGAGWLDKHAGAPGWTAWPRHPPVYQGLLHAPPRLRPQLLHVDSRWETPHCEHRPPGAPGCSPRTRAGRRRTGCGRTGGGRPGPPARSARPGTAPARPRSPGGGQRERADQDVGPRRDARPADLVVRPCLPRQDPHRRVQPHDLLHGGRRERQPLQVPVGGRPFAGRSTTCWRWARA